MKRKSIVTILILAFALIFTNTALVFASEPIENDLVSLEEFIEAITNTAAKYGSEIEILDSSGYIPITREELQSLLKYMEEAGKANIEAKNAYEAKIKSYKDDSKVIPFVMPVSTTLKGTFDVISLIPAGFATFQYEADAVYDASRSRWISWDPKETFILQSLNCDDSSLKFTTEEWNRYIVNGWDHLEYVAEGRVTFYGKYNGLDYRNTVPFFHNHPFVAP